MLRCGYWSHHERDRTLRFDSGRYIYEVDLERPPVERWANHLRETKSGVMRERDIEDMAELWRAVTAGNGSR